MPRRAAELDLDLNLNLDLDLNLGRRCKGVEPYTNPIAHHQTPTRARTPTLTQADAKAASPSAPSPSPSQPHTSVRKACSHDATAARLHDATASLMIRWLKSDRVAEGSSSIARQELLIERVAQVEVRLGIARLQSHCSRKGGGGLCMAGTLVQSVAMIVMTVGAIWLRREGKLKGSDCL